MSKKIKGFSLIEVSIALAILSSCFVIVLGMIPTSLKIGQTTSDEFEAQNILSGVELDIKFLKKQKENQMCISKLPIQGDYFEKKLFYLNRFGDYSRVKSEYTVLIDQVAETTNTVFIAVYKGSGFEQKKRPISYRLVSLQ